MASTTHPPAPAPLAPASSLKTNLAYLVKGPTGTALRPSSLQTRSTLRSLRYLSKFVFWRLLRYLCVALLAGSWARSADVMRRRSSKYAALAAGATALAGTALGASLPWIAAIAVPSVPVAAAIGLTTAVIKVRRPPLLPQPPDPRG